MLKWPEPWQQTPHDKPSPHTEGLRRAGAILGVIGSIIWVIAEPVSALFLLLPAIFFAALFLMVRMGMGVWNRSQSSLLEWLGTILAGATGLAAILALVGSRFREDDLVVLIVFLMPCCFLVAFGASAWGWCRLKEQEVTDTPTRLKVLAKGWLGGQAAIAIPVWLLFHAA